MHNIYLAISECIRLTHVNAYFYGFFIKPFLPLRNEDLNERLIDVQLILFKR